MSSLSNQIQIDQFDKNSVEPNMKIQIYGPFLLQWTFKLWPMFF